MKKIVYISFCLILCFITHEVSAQTYSYKSLYALKDGIKMPGLYYKKGDIAYFTFTNNKSRCYKTDKNGVYYGGYGIGVFEYLREEKGVLIYKEMGGGAKGGFDELYITDDFKMLCWFSYYDEGSPQYRGSLRVFEYTDDPNSVEVPSELY